MVTCFGEVMVNSTLFYFFLFINDENIFPKSFSHFLTDGSFNEEIYTISDVKTTLDVPLFKLKRHDGKEMLGHYYSHELSRVRGDPSYRIESVLRRRKGKALVQFSGYKKT